MPTAKYETYKVYNFWTNIEKRENLDFFFIQQKIQFFFTILTFFTLHIPHIAVDKLPVLIFIVSCVHDNQR